MFKKIVLLVNILFLFGCNFIHGKKEMAFNSYDVVAGDDILAADHNLLRQDVREANIDLTTRYYAINPSAALPHRDDSEWEVLQNRIRPNSNTFALWLYYPINLPHGAVVKSYRVYWYRDDALASGTSSLRACNFTDSYWTMGDSNSDVATGFHYTENTNILYPIIDNINRTYCLYVTLDPNDFIADVRFNGAVITYTINKSLP